MGGGVNRGVVGVVLRFRTEQDGGFFRVFQTGVNRVGGIGGEIFQVACPLVRMQGFLCGQGHMQLFFTRGHHADFAALVGGHAQAGGEQRLLLAQVGTHHQHGLRIGKVGDVAAQPLRACQRAFQTAVLFAQAGGEVAAADAVGQFFRQIEFFQRVHGVGPKADLLLVAVFSDALDAVAHVFERGLPIHVNPFAALFDFRVFQTAFVVQAFVGEAVAVGQPAFVDGFVFQRQHATHGVLFGLHNQVAAQCVVGGHGFAAVQFPGAGVEAEGFAGKRAHGAKVDDVAGKFGFHGAADEGEDFGMFAAVGDADFLVAGDFFGETHAAGAVDAAAHFLRGNQRAHVFGHHGAFGFGVAGGGFAVADGQILQLAFTAFVAHGAVERVVDEQEFHHAFLRLPGHFGMGMHHHAVGYRRGAGRQRLGRFFHFHQAHAAAGGDGKFFVVTEVGDVGAELLRRFNHGRALLYRYFLTVNADL